MGGYRFDDDKFIPSLGKVAEVIRKYDCPAFFQVFGGGPPGPPGTPAARASAISQEEMNKVTGGLMGNLPGGFKIPGM